jgi:hypothetical protein
MFRVITGIVITIIGLSLALIGWQTDLFTGIIGLVIVGLGLAIILNKDEDKIEKINNQPKNSNHE